MAYKINGFQPGDRFLSVTYGAATEVCVRTSIPNRNYGNLKLFLFFFKHIFYKKIIKKLFTTTFDNLSRIAYVRFPTVRYAVFSLSNDSGVQTNNQRGDNKFHGCNKADTSFEKILVVPLVACYVDGRRYFANFTMLEKDL